MRKKDLVFYVLILVLVILFLWQPLSKGGLVAQLNRVQNLDDQVHFMSGIGPLGSTHQHADVKVYINGQSLDFSQRKYQLTTSFIHFEEGIGDVTHTHASGLTLGHLMKSVGIDFSSNCLVFESQSYCNNNDNSLKFYVNGQPSNDFDNKVIEDSDKYLISYGSEDVSQIQQQIDSVTNLATRYSGG